MAQNIQSLNSLASIIAWVGQGQSVHDAFLWTCPVCSKGATITSANRHVGSVPLRRPSPREDHLVTISIFVECPNPACRQFSFYALLYKAIEHRGRSSLSFVPASNEPLGSWQLVPASEARSYPDYVPRPIREDYTEAYLIRDLSPKASATLARRCLQGMIRDFHDVGESNLKKAIEAIRDKVDPLTWQAIDAVRSIGNIGAHMERDINLIVAVEPEEADALLGLIEYLIQDWYVNRHEREERLKSIVALKDAKQQARKSPPAQS